MLLVLISKLSFKLILSYYGNVTIELCLWNESGSKPQDLDPILYCVVDLEGWLTADVYLLSCHA